MARRPRRGRARMECAGDIAGADTLRNAWRGAHAAELDDRQGGLRVRTAEEGCPMRRIGALCVLWVIALVACNGEQRRLQQKSELLEQERMSLSQRIDKRQAAVRETSDKLDALNRELTMSTSNAQSLIAAHRIAVSCIRAARSTWGENNTFSRDVPTTARFGTALCSVGLLNAQFAAEVGRVADQLNEADAHVRTLKEQIAAAERQLTADRSELEKSEAAVREIGAEIAEVRQQMNH